jgi:hypothetical protein
VALNHSAVKIGKGLLSPPELSLQLYLMGAKIANQTEQEELCYEFFVEVSTFYLIIGFCCLRGINIGIEGAIKCSC